MPKYLDYHGLETLKNDLELIYVKLAQRGVANGVASLNAEGKVPTSQLPNISGLPAGGSQGQVLAKSSGADYAVEWVNQTGGAVIDDTAGVGVTNKAWSANKIATALSSLPAPTSIIDDSDSVAQNKVWSSSKLNTKLQNVLYLSNADGNLNLQGNEGAVCSVGQAYGYLRVSVPFKHVRSGAGVSDFTTIKSIDGRSTNIHYFVNDGVLDLEATNLEGQLKMTKCSNTSYTDPDNPVYEYSYDLINLFRVASTEETQAIIYEYGGASA